MRNGSFGLDELFGVDQSPAERGGEFGRVRARRHGLTRQCQPGEQQIRRFLEKPAHDGTLPFCRNRAHIEHDDDARCVLRFGRARHVRDMGRKQDETARNGFDLAHAPGCVLVHLLRIAEEERAAIAPVRPLCAADVENPAQPSRSGECVGL